MLIKVWPGRKVQLNTTSISFLIQKNKSHIAVSTKAQQVQQVFYGMRSIKRQSFHFAHPPKESQDMQGVLQLLLPPH